MSNSAVKKLADREDASQGMSPETLLEIRVMDNGYVLATRPKGARLVFNSDSETLAAVTRWMERVRENDGGCNSEKV